MSKITPKIKFLTEIPKDVGILDIKYADIQTIPFLPDNIKGHDKEGIKESIRVYGFVEPIGINRRTGHDIFGNGRLECLLEMRASGENCPKGIVEKVIESKSMTDRDKTISTTLKWFAPVVDGIDLSPEDEEILAIKMNVTNQKGGLDNIKAYEYLKTLKARSEEKFNLTGYNAADLERIQMLAKFHTQVAEMKTDATKTIDENDGSETGADAEKEFENICVEFNRKWKVESGDMFQIGNHRLICADSRFGETYKRLLDDKKIRLVVTSPPYDNQRDYELAEKIDWTGLMTKVSASYSEYLAEISDVMVNLGIIYKDRQVYFYWNDWLKFAKEELKNPLFGFYVWDKLSGMAGDHNGRLAPAHELLFHFSRGEHSANKWIEKSDASLIRGPKKTNYRLKDGGFKGISSPEALEQPFKVPDSVIRMQKELSRGIHTEGHPATYPVALPAFIIKTYSLIGEIVCDPFLGSGSSMIACEQLDRVCVGIDESKNYCALILERMHREFPNLEIKRI